MAMVAVHIFVIYSMLNVNVDRSMLSSMKGSEKAYVEHIEIEN